VLVLTCRLLHGRLGTHINAPAWNRDARPLPPHPPEKKRWTATTELVCRGYGRRPGGTRAALSDRQTHSCTRDAGSINYLTIATNTRQPDRIRVRWSRASSLRSIRSFPARQHVEWRDLSAVAIKLLAFIIHARFVTLPTPTTTTA